MYLAKPVAFDSINFLPGFPSLSAYDCNPWSMSYKAGSCGSAPMPIGRERGTMPASEAMRQAMLAAGAAPGQLQAMLDRGIVPASLAGMGDVSPQQEADGLGGGGGGLMGCGCGCNGSPGGCGGGDHSHAGNWRGPWAGGRAFGLSGRGLGAVDFSVQGILDYITANAVPLGIGAAAVYFLERKGRR